ncbi:MAG: radical SAM protein, partial [Oscillospiraceae bacterium]
MKDNTGRKINYLRLSVTERCSLHCSYCRADEQDCPEKEELTAEEFGKIAEVCARLGIDKVRLTGGEPLMRKDIESIIETLKAIDGLHEISMTTNAQQLCGRVKNLAAAGISRFNVSCDSLDPQKFRALTGGELDKVLRAVDEIVDAELFPLKLNVVLMRGVNDGEVDDFIALAKDRPIDVRFIELMPLGKIKDDKSLRVTSAELIASRPYLEPVKARYGGQPSRDYIIKGYVGRIGFISPMSHSYTAQCNRLSIITDGMLSPCHGRDSENSL